MNKLQVIQIVTKLLVGLTILLIVGCESWKNRPHVGDYENEKIIFEGDHSSNEVHCNEKSFNEYICWHYSEIADLLSILDKHKIKCKEAKKIKKIINKLDIL